MDAIKIYIGEVGWGGLNWIDLVPDKDQWRAITSTVMYFRVP